MNFDLRLDEILAKLPQYNLGQDPITDEDFTPDETFAVYPELEEAKQSLTSLIKELVAEAKPEVKAHPLGPVTLADCQRGLDHYEANLLKALEDK